MKKLLFFLLIIFASVLPGCKKGASLTESTVYKGVVLFSICDHTVIQTIGPNYIGQDNWASGTNAGAPVYNHVFTVQNGCQFGNYTQGDTISFRVIATQVQNCLSCMIAVATPDSMYPVQVIN